VNVANRAGEASSWCYWRRTALGRFVGNPELDCPLVSVSVWPVIQAQFCGSASDAAMAT